MHNWYQTDEIYYVTGVSILLPRQFPLLLGTVFMLASLTRCLIKRTCGDWSVGIEVLWRRLVNLERSYIHMQEKAAQILEFHSWTGTQQTERSVQMFKKNLSLHEHTSDEISSPAMCILMWRFFRVCAFYLDFVTRVCTGSAMLAGWIRSLAFLSFFHRFKVVLWDYYIHFSCTEETTDQFL